MNAQAVRVVTDVDVTMKPVVSDDALVGFEIIRGQTDELRYLREVFQAAQNTLRFGFSQYYQDKLRALVERKGEQ